jgi:ABC-2 type transport system permease protein
MKRFSTRQAINVVLAMGWADFVLKYRGSALGYLWSLIVPLVKFLVMYHVFRPFASSIAYYPLYLFLGLILWEHFALTTQACIGMLHDKASIIKKVMVPRVLFIFSVGWTHLIILCTYFLIFLAFCIFLGAGLTVEAIVYLPLLLLQATLLSLGTGMFLSAYALRFRDIQHLWGIVLQVLFWLTPVMYAYKPSSPLFREALTIIAGGVNLSLWSVFDVFIRFQPLSILMYDARKAILYSMSEGMPSVFHMSLFTLICAVIFLAGMMVFIKRSRYFIQEY